MFTYSYTNKKG